MGQCQREMADADNLRRGTQSIAKRCFLTTCALTLSLSTNVVLLEIRCVFDAVSVTSLLNSPPSAIFLDMRSSPHRFPSIPILILLTFRTSRYVKLILVFLSFFTTQQLPIRNRVWAQTDISCNW